jgi:hypothetical protein
MKPPFEEKETHELWLVVSRAGIYPCTDLTVHLPHSLFLSTFFLLSFLGHCYSGSAPCEATNICSCSEFGVTT